MSKPGLLTLTIKDKSALYLAYMPYVVNGGLFIPTNSSYRLGDEVFMLLNLMGEEEKIPVAGTVIFGTGFAPFRGGPINYAKERGVDLVIASLRDLADRHGDRFAPHSGWSDV